MTDAATMAIARRVFEEANATLTAGLVAAGIPASPLLNGVFAAAVKRPELGFVGEVSSVVTTEVDALLAAGRVPILTSLGFDAAGAALNINADVAARELAVALRPRRVVYVSAGGGWKEGGVVVGALDLSVDYAPLAARDYTGRQGTLLKLNEMKELVTRLPLAASVAIASASDLGACVLPGRGPGTQIRRGQRVLTFASAGGVDGTRLASLLQTGGGATATAGLAALSGPVHIAVLEDYSAAVVVRTDGKLPVVACMALAPHAYLEGAEVALWRSLTSSFPSGVVWAAPPAPTAEAAAAAVATGGLAAIPGAFPPLSLARSGEFAHGSSSLPSGGHVCWVNVPPTSLGGVVSAVYAPPPPAPSVVRPVVSAKPVRVGLLGARGFVGREFLRLLGGHPSLQVVVASSRALVGADTLTALGVPDAWSAVTPGLLISDVGPDELRAGAHPPVDVWVLALPNGLAATHTAAIESAAAASRTLAPLILDLSADMRFEAPSSGWTYGLPERPGCREALKVARKISNPGCYATGAQTALLPFLPMHAKSGAGGLVWDVPKFKPSVFGVSGYSGAGTTPSEKNDTAVLR